MITSFIKSYLCQVSYGNSRKSTKIDAGLEPQKQFLNREWLANNPTETPAGFEKKAWHLLKENLIAQRNAEVLNANLKAARASERYSLQDTKTLLSCR
jgi:hypothetical protein